MGNRKEEILIVALHLFARDGYEAVSVSQIAAVSYTHLRAHETEMCIRERSLLAR